MFSGLLLILLALFVGYAIQLKKPEQLRWISRISAWVLYLILFVMGYSLSSVENLGKNLALLAGQASFLLLGLALFNIAALAWLGKVISMPKASPLRQQAGNNDSAFKDALKLVGLVVLGALSGLVIDAPLPAQSEIIDKALLLLLFCIGIELRSAGISLRELLLNRRGMLIALVVILSSIPVGFAAAWVFELPLTTGLALVSGFGWYSLSGALIGDALSPILGSTALLVDLGRELLTLLLIPWLMPRSPSATIGYAGATAMDFSLPMLQRAGGHNVVPLAIASGLILSLACPLLILTWLSIGSLG